MPENAEIQSTNYTAHVVTIIVITALLTMGIGLFYAKNFFYGIIVLTMPVIFILTGIIYCYNRKDTQEADDDSFEFPPDEEEPMQRYIRSHDEPPNYRNTWRRSFMKRMRGRKSFRLHTKPEIDSTAGDQELETPTENPEEVIWPIITTEDPPPAEVSQNDDTLKREETSHSKLENVSSLSDGLPSYDEAIRLSIDHLDQS